MKRSIVSGVLVLAIAFPNALFAQSTAPTADKYANHELNVRNAMQMPILLNSLFTSSGKTDTGIIGAGAFAFAGLVYMMLDSYADVVRPLPIQSLAEIEIINNETKLKEYLYIRSQGKNNPHIQHFTFLNSTMDQLDGMFKFIPEEESFRFQLRKGAFTYSARQVSNLLNAVAMDRNFLPDFITLNPEGIAQIFHKFEIEGFSMKRFEVGVKDMHALDMFRKDLSIAYQKIVTQRNWTKGFQIVGFGALFAAVMSGVAYYFLVVNGGETASILDRKNLTPEDMFDMIAPVQANEDTDRKYDLETFHILLTEDPGFAKKMSIAKDRLEQQVRERNHTMKEFNNYVASLKN